MHRVIVDVIDQFLEIILTRYQFSMKWPFKQASCSFETLVYSLSVCIEQMRKLFGCIDDLRLFNCRIFQLAGIDLIFYFIYTNK